MKSDFYLKNSCRKHVGINMYQMNLGLKTLHLPTISVEQMKTEFPRHQNVQTTFLKPDSRLTYIPARGSPECTYKRCIAISYADLPKEVKIVIDSGTLLLQVMIIYVLLHATGGSPSFIIHIVVFSRNSNKAAKPNDDEDDMEDFHKKGIHIGGIF